MSDENSGSKNLETRENKEIKQISSKVEQDGIVNSKEQLSVLGQMLESNPDNIDGSVGRLLALKQGMTLKDVQPFLIAMDDGTNVGTSDSKQLIAQTTPLEHHHSKHKRHEAPHLVEAHGVSNDFFQQSLQKIETIPKAHRDWLATHDYKIEVVKDVASYDAEHGTTYATDHPEGYEPGWTAANLDVFFDSTNNRVVVVENFNRVPGSTNVMGTAGRIRHEAGHALDQSKNFLLQDDPAVQRMYDEAVNRLSHSPVTAHALDYYLQPPTIASDGSVSRPGLRETIAELYATMHGDHSGAAAGPSIDKSLTELFKDTLIPYMQRKGY